jgi:hypothetical protein
MPEDGPADIKIVQFPRNFYFYFGPETVAFPDMWLFHVFSREGWPGLHYYFQRVFDVPIDGMFYVNMDNFITFIDTMFPDGFAVPSMSDDWKISGASFAENGPIGKSLLAWLRDNDNNWGCPQYDCGDRQVRTVFAIAQALKGRFQDKPVDSILKTWDVYSELFETDLSTAEQIIQGAQLAHNLMNQDYTFSAYKLTEADGVEYGDTPLEVRGWIVTDQSAMQTWLWSKLR